MYYKVISSEKRMEMEQELYNAVLTEFRREEVQTNIYKYEVVIQDLNFVTCMTDEEVRLSAGYTIDLLEELKVINNNGIDRQTLEQLVKEMEEKEQNEVLQTIGIWNKISTNRMAELFAKIDILRRVGGAWAMLIANPGLIRAVYVVFEQLVDQFENEELYLFSGYFLLRAIMKMHSDEVEKFD